MDLPNSHVCQKCSVPLKLPAPSSEENTSPNVIEEPPIAVEVAAVRKKNQKPALPKFTEDHYADRATTSKKDAECQTHVPTVQKTAQSAPGKFSQFLETKIRLKEILEGDVELDTPLCVSCSDTLIETIDERIKETEDEIRDERLYLLGLDTKKDEDEEESIEELRAELARLQAEERKLIQCCDNLKFERDITFKGRDLLNRQLAGLEKSLERETRDYFRLKNDWFAASHELLSLENQYAYFQKRLDTLNDTNAFEEMFKIRCDDVIGEINGFRLGSLTVCPVTWKEINFAWGEALSLLAILAKMFEFDFKKYVLIPLGDRSRIEMPAKKSKKLPLHYAGESEGHIFSDFDAGQVAFLESLTLLEGGIRARFKDFKLKHSISSHKIVERDSKVGYSIAYDVNARDAWTKALKCVLENLKQILTLFVEKVRDKRTFSIKPKVSDQRE